MQFITSFWQLAIILISISAMGQNLESYKWENRILLLKDVQYNSSKLQEQLTALQADPETLEDRDLLIFILTDEAVFDPSQRKVNLQSHLIIEEYGLKNFQGLILLGKDGGTKLKQSFVVSPMDIFNLIDSMPMRRAEIESSKKN